MPRVLPPSGFITNWIPKGETFTLNPNITDFQYRQIRTGRNLIYKIKNADGSIDQVERILNVFRGVERPNLTPAAKDINALREIASWLEQTKVKFVGTVAGQLVSKTCIAAAPKEYVTVPQILTLIQKHEAQVKELHGKIAELTLKLEKETAAKEAIKIELEVTKGKLAVIEGFLKEALNVYRSS